METPNYVLSKGDNLAVNVRALYNAAGYEDRYYPDWFNIRAKNLKLQKEEQFVTVKNGAFLYHIVSVPTARAILEVERLTAKRQMSKPIVMQLRQMPQQEPQISLLEFTLPATPEVLPLDELEPVKTPVSPQLSITATPEDGVKTAVETNGPLPVFLRDGKAAVFAKSIFKLWQTGPDRYFSQWIKYRAEKLGFVVGKQYQRSEVGGLDYVLSLDAAIEIATNEPKKRGEELRNYLLNLKKQLKRSGLPAKAKLSDFVGMTVPEPTHEPEQVATPPVLELGLIGLGPDSIVVQSANDAVKLENAPTESTEANTGAQAGDSEKPEQLPTHEENAAERAGNEAQSGEYLTEIDEPYLEPVDPDEQAERLAEDEIKRDLSNYGRPVIFGTGLDRLAPASRMEDIPVTPQMWASINDRVEFLEMTVGQLVAILQSQSRAMMGLNKSSERMPEMTLRQKINVLVNKQAGISGVDQEELFTWIYQQLLYRYGHRVKGVNRRADESYLQVAEREGYIDKVYAIVTSDEFKAYNGAGESAAA